MKKSICFWQLGTLFFIGALMLIGSGAIPEAELNEEEDIQLSLRRYRKGIELTRTLYEKLLALDHHFSHEQMIWGGTPPYAKKLNDGSSLQMPNHPGRLANCSHLLMEMDREVTVLRIRNATLLADCLRLFDQYTQVVDYHQSLEICRDTDDWEQLETRILFFEQNWAEIAGSTPQEQWRKLIDLEFAVDRMLNFLNRYLAHVMDCQVHFQAIGIWSRQQMDQLEPQDSQYAEWEQIGNQVYLALEKFESAYSLPEVQGSRLKDLLYGFSED